MSQPITVKVLKRSAGYEGVVEFRGMQPTKLVRQDKTTTFVSLSALKTTARSVAQRLGTTVEYVELANKQAAKTSVKSKSPTSTPTS